MFSTKDEQEKKIKKVQSEPISIDSNINYTWRVIGEEYFKVKSCNNCAKEFLLKGSNKGSLFCSVKCRKMYEMHNKSTPNIVCKECSALFIASPENETFCSKECVSGYVSKKIRGNKKFISFTIFQRDKFSCVYCGASPISSPDTTLVIDHVYPISRGGKNDLFNLVTACFKCNQNKSNVVFSKDQIFELWDRIERANQAIQEISETYDQMVIEFDKVNRKRLKAV